MEETFGKFLKKRRSELGLTLKVLAEKSGLSYVQLSRLQNEKNKPSALTIAKLKNPLQMDSEDIVKYSK